MENSKRPVVLCVDDERSVLSALRRAFLDEPWDLVFADSGPRGLELIEERGADVVVADYRMPGMNGVEFLKRVREVHPECMRVVLSGYADVAAILAALNEGAIYRFVHKPWNDAELLESIRKALEHHGLRRENQRLRAERGDTPALRFAREVLELLPLPILGIDEMGLVTYANAWARETLDPGGQGLVGQPVPTAITRAPLSIPYQGIEVVPLENSDTVGALIWTKDPAALRLLLAGTTAAELAGAGEENR